MSRTYILIIAFILLFAGCSGGSNDPISGTKTPGSIDNIPIIDLSQASGITQATGLLGAYEITINPENMTAELVSKRTSAIGDSYIVSGVAFFTMLPCADCLQIVGVSLDLDGNGWLKFEITHPFVAGDPLMPPSASNRNDLDVFDLAMVIHPTGVTPQTFSQTGESAYNTSCVGASGYTSELSNFLSDTAAMPYFLCVDDSTDASPPLSTWNKFAMGTTTLFESGFFLSGPLSFDTYLTMGYGHSAVKADRLTPKYYNPEFNRKAAWKVVADAPTGTTIGTTWDTLNIFPQDVVVSVYDWQIGADVYSDPLNFGDALETEIFAASDPTQVTVEVLGMSASLPTATAPDDPIATGGPDDPWVYTINVPHDASTPLAAGSYPGLVAVADSRVPVGAPPAATNDYLIDSPDGIVLNFFDIDEYVTYQTFVANVVLGCGPVTGSITTPASCPVTGVGNGGSVDFVVSASSGNGGDPVIQYDVDYDYDGITFTSDDNNATGNFPGGGPFTVADPCIDNIPQDFTVAFRGTDSCVPPNQTIFATCVITVDSCAVPVGNVSLVVNRLGLSGSYTFDSTAPWTLSWDAANGAASYAIYYDSNPADGLTNSLSYVDETTSTSFDVPASHLPTNHYVVGNTYIVRTRTIAGDGGSELDDSEPAHITTNGCETFTSTTQNNGEGWTANCQHTSSSYYLRPRSSNSWGVANGIYHYQFSFAVGANYSNTWDGIMKQTPTVPNSSVRRMECFARHFQTYYPSGLIFGTSPSAPTWNFQNPDIIEWASVDSTSPFTGYGSNSTDVRSTFSGVPASGNCAWLAGSYSSEFLYGGDVNVDGDPADPYVVIEYVKLNTYSTQPYPIMDEISIVIY